MSNLNMVLPLMDLELLNNSLPSAIAVLECGKELRVVQANNSFFDLIAYTREEFSQKYKNCCSGIMRVLDDERGLDTALCSSPADSFTKIKLIKKDGTHLKLNIQSRPVTSDEGAKLILAQISLQPETPCDKIMDINGIGFENPISAFDNDMQFEYDFDTKVFICSKYFADRLGILPCVENFPQSLIDENIIRDEHVLSFFNLNAERRKASVKKKISFYTKEGQVYFYNMKLDMVLDKKNKPFKITGNFEELGNSTAELADLSEQGNIDELTGLLKKSTMERLIENDLSKLLPGQNCALLIVDIDNFDSINTELGQIFANAVLGDIGHILKSKFRDSDMIGRIGDDEFFIFMRNLSDLTLPQKRAKELCSVLKKEYVKNDKKIQLSVSIGIALCPDHGTVLEQLYNKADIALSAAKRDNTRDYVQYTSKHTSQSATKKDRIYSLQGPQKKFRDNRIEYVFRLLYTSNDFEECLDSILQLLAEHFNFSRSYIFEFSEDAEEHSCTFEWCKPGFKPSIHKMQNIKTNGTHSLLAPNMDDEYFVMNNVKELGDRSEKLVHEYDVKYILHFGVWDGERPVGFIGFADCERIYNLQPDEIAEIGIICRMMGVFLAKYRLKEKYEKENAYLP